MERLEKYERRLQLRAPSTRKNYRHALNKFLRFSGLTKEELLQLAETDLGEVELLVGEAMQADIDRGNKPTTARLIYKGVRFFMRATGFKNFSLDREDKPRVVYSGSRRTTKDHIREFWDIFNPKFQTRNRAILMFLKDSGLRISDACALDVEHYRAASTPAEGFRVFGPTVTQKTGDIAHIHIGPEAVRALDRYLKDRRTEPLFLNQYGRRLSPHSMSEIFGKVKRRRDLEEDFNNISAHSLRKYHYTLLPFREDWIRWLEGKATDVYVDGPKVTRAYIDSYDELKVFTSEEELRAKLKEEENRLKRVSEARREYERKLQGIRDEVQAMVREELARLREPVE